MKTATEILFEYSINIMNMNDEFNCQLLTAMERYAEQFKQPKSESRMYSIEEMFEFVGWIASVSISDEYNTNQRIELCDGQWYWSNDDDGDCPLSEQELYTIFLEHKKTKLQSIQPKTEESLQFLANQAQELNMGYEPKTEELKEGLKPCPNHPDVLISQCGICNGTFPKLEQPKTEEVIGEIQFPFDDKKSYPEDFSHENGQYQNRCFLCTHYFLGHKRRVMCKECFTKTELVKPKEQPTSPSIEKMAEEFVNYHYSFFTNDTRKKMVIGICDFIKTHKANNSLEELEKWVKEVSIKTNGKIFSYSLLDKIQQLKNK